LQAQPGGHRGSSSRRKQQSKLAPGRCPVNLFAANHPLMIVSRKIDAARCQSVLASSGRCLLQSHIGLI
jgi:hypothetical protein